jgi:hypothetical protein
MMSLHRKCSGLLAFRFRALSCILKNVKEHSVSGIGYISVLRWETPILLAPLQIHHLTWGWKAIQFLKGSLALRIPSSGMLHHVTLVTTGVSEERIASIIKVTRIGVLETLAVTSNRTTLRRNTVCERKR